MTIGLIPFVIQGLIRNPSLLWISASPGMTEPLMIDNALYRISLYQIGGLSNGNLGMRINPFGD
jgi:hypothetical protein